MNNSQLPDRVQTRRMLKSLNQLSLEAKATPQSGAGIIKGDIIDKYFRHELKTRAKPCKQITVQKLWYDKVEAECLMNDRLPTVVFGFGDDCDIISMRVTVFKQFLETILKEEQK